MKIKITNIILAALTALYCFAPCARAASAVNGLFVSEICFDPAYETDSKKVLSDNDYFEFIEVVNTGLAAVDLRGAQLRCEAGGKIKSNALIFEKGGSTVMLPGEIWVIGVYTARTHELGIGYETAEELKHYWREFERYYEAELPLGRRALAEGAKSGSEEMNENGFCLPNSGNEAIISLYSGGKTLCSFTYCPDKYRANGYSIHNVIDNSMAFTLGCGGCSPGRLESFQNGSIDLGIEPAGEKVSVVEYNVCCKASDPAAELETGSRIKRLLQFVNGERADIYCFNEASEPWMAALIENIKEYRWEGKSCYGAENGKGTEERDTYNPVFWNTNKFQSLMQGSRYLRGSGPFRGNKVCSYVLLQSLRTRKTVLVVNTHLSSDGENGDFTCRAEEINNLGKILKEIKEEAQAKAGENGSPAVILCGDMNVHEGSPSYRRLIKNTGLKDSKFYARHMLPFSTFNDWGKRPGFNGTIIDYCLFDSAFIESYEVIAENAADGLPVSDHNALKIEAVI